MSADSFEHGPDGLKRNTHLLSWLDDGYTHCQHGTQGWCESYLKNAAEVIRAQDDRIARMEAALAAVELERDRLRENVKDLGERKRVTGHFRDEYKDRAQKAEAALEWIAREAPQPTGDDLLDAVTKFFDLRNYASATLAGVPFVSHDEAAAALSSSKQKDGGK